MDRSLLTKKFEMTIDVDILTLEEHIDFFISKRDEIIMRWMQDVTVKQTLIKFISTEVFALDYAQGIYDYYLDVITAKVELGDCPTMKRFLEYCSEEKIEPHSLYLICSGLRNSIVFTAMDEVFFTKYIYKQITLITDQNFAGVIYIYSEILRQNRLKIKQINKQLLEQYLYDELTGLKNTNALKEDLLDDAPKVLLLFDINRLHEINESYGYESGDIILIQMANFLAEVYEEYRPQLYRLFGDEFAVLIDIESINGISPEELAQSFQDQLIATRFSLIDDIVAQVPLQVSIGMSTSPDLIIHASTALHIAKEKDLVYVIKDTSKFQIAIPK